MAIRVYKPVTNGRRNASVNLHEEVTHTGRPEKSLVTALPKTGGRNHHGVITCRGGCCLLYTSPSPRDLH